MNWKKERDALIAETMAFVQSVTGKRAEASRSDGNFASAVAPELLPLPELERAPAAAPPAPRPIAPGDMASEIRARVASFRAHQERFNREREQYFSATLERLRAAIKDPDSPHLDP